jgi:hypothetical protein
MANFVFGRTRQVSRASHFVCDCGNTSTQMFLDHFPKMKHVGPWYPGNPAFFDITLSSVREELVVCG